METFLITDAKSNKKRMRVYLILMGIRVISFILAIFIPLPYNILLITGAVVIPYIAVVIANSSDENFKGYMNEKRDLESSKVKSIE